MLLLAGTLFWITAGPLPASQHAAVVMPPPAKHSKRMVLGSSVTSYDSIATRPNGISYHGGPVMLGTINIYLIWYGNWSGDSAPEIITDLARNIGGTPYFNINTSYYNTAGTRLTNSVRYVASAWDTYSRGSNITVGDSYSIVMDSIHSGALGPADSNGIYFVLTSPDVSMPGFKTDFCGWHSYQSKYDFPELRETTVKIAFIGNSIDACAVQLISPNDNAGADAMANIFSHELEEAATDPLLSAWYDDFGKISESADKCSYSMGVEQTTLNGSRYNQTIGSRRYLIQQNWINDGGGYCGQSWGPLLTGWNELVSRNSNLCLDVTSASKDPGARLEQWTCWGGANQLFGFNPVPGGYAISSLNSGLQLDVAGGPDATGPGIPVIQYPYWGGSNEVWNISNPDADGYVTVTALHSGKCLDIENMDKEPGAKLEQWICWAGDNQKWKLVPLP
jgi:hypothetical protein